MIPISIVLALLFWAFESGIHARAFDEPYTLWPTDLNELWMRILICCLFLALGISAQINITNLRRHRDEREQLQRQLTESLTKVLDDFIPICANCKKIREDSEWTQIEKYITNHTNSLFSHSVCPECAKTLYPELKIQE